MCSIDLTYSPSPVHVPSAPDQESPDVLHLHPDGRNNAARILSVLLTMI